MNDRPATVDNLLTYLFEYYPMHIAW